MLCPDVPPRPPPRSVPVSVADMTPVLHLSLPVHDLDAARRFYVEALGCRPGRTRERWIDVWFFGLQLTLHLSPTEVRASDAQGVRHFGVVLGAADYADVLDRLEEHDVEWLSPPTTHEAIALSGKAGGMLADPSGNVVEIKHYADPTDFLHLSPSTTGPGEHPSR